MNIFDAHCHLQDHRLDRVLSDCVEEAFRCGVRYLACNGTSEADWADVERIAGRFAGVLPMFGLHPWFVHRRTSGWLSRLKEYLVRNPAAGVGEVGLDFAIDSSSREEQEEVFRLQLDLARRLDRPVSIHCRRAFHRLVPLLKSSLSGPAPPFLIHSFSASVGLVDELTSLGAYFSFSGSCTLKRNRRARKAIAVIAGDRLLAETDCPDLAPYPESVFKAFSLFSVQHPSVFVEPGRDRRLNVPQNILCPISVISSVRELAPVEAAELTFANACRFFRVQPRKDGQPSSPDQWG